MRTSCIPKRQAHSLVSNANVGAVVVKPANQDKTDPKERPTHKGQYVALHKSLVDQFGRMDRMVTIGACMNFTFTPHERPKEGRESVHSGDIFLGERVAGVRDEQASLTDGSVTNDDEFHALMPFASQ